MLRRSPTLARTQLQMAPWHNSRRQTIHAHILWPTCMRNIGQAYAINVDAVALSYLKLGGDLLFRLVVSCKAMDARLDENESELGVPVFPVDLEMLAHRDGLFDQVPQVLWDGGGQSCTMEAVRNTAHPKVAQASPLDLRILKILLPVTNRTCGIPCESRRRTPI